MRYVPVCIIIMNQKSMVEHRKWKVISNGPEIIIDHICPTGLTFRFVRNLARFLKSWIARPGRAKCLGPSVGDKYGPDGWLQKLQACIQAVKV